MLTFCKACKEPSMGEVWGSSTAEHIFQEVKLRASGGGMIGVSGLHASTWPHVVDHLI